MKNNILFIFLTAMVFFQCSDRYDRCQNIDCGPGSCLNGACDCPVGFIGINCEFLSCDSEFKPEVNKIDSGNSSHRKSALANSENSIYAANYVEETMLSKFNSIDKTWRPIVNSELDSSILKVLNKGGRVPEIHGNNRLGGIDISGDTLWVCANWGGNFGAIRLSDATILIDTSYHDIDMPVNGLGGIIVQFPKLYLLNEYREGKSSVSCFDIENDFKLEWNSEIINTNPLNGFNGFTFHGDYIHYWSEYHLSKLNSTTGEIVLECSMNDMNTIITGATYFKNSFWMTDFEGRLYEVKSQ